MLVKEEILLPLIKGTHDFHGVIVQFMYRLVGVIYIYIYDDLHTYRS